MDKLSIEDINVKGKKVFLRVDFNVPLDENQKITDPTRILFALPTIKYLINQGAKLILASHLGRPKGSPVVNLSLRPIANYLEQVINIQVRFCPTILGEVTKAAINTLNNGECLLLENLRFFPEEEENDPLFSKELASLAELFVNDAFGTAHRAHASTYGVAKYFDNAAAGKLMQKELKYLSSLVDKPKRPMTAILGGAKVQDKIKVIMRLLEKADEIIIGGGMAYTFLKAQNHTIGNSMIDLESLDMVTEILKKAQQLNKNIYLPMDHIITDAFKIDANIRKSDIDIPDNWMGLDIGKKTIESYCSVIRKSKTVVWNGPMGVFEMKPFQEGTFGIAKETAKCKGITVIGGGDSVSAVNKIKLAKKVSHISTGGGASLELLEGKELPGISALGDKI